MEIWDMGLGNLIIEPRLILNHLSYNMHTQKP